ncbi:hypothetical protein BH23GEM6_BH23GEM6_13190 [soil metagenome]
MHEPMKQPNTTMNLLSRRALMSTVALAVGLSASPAQAQWSTAYEQFYLPASHNWAFRQNYNAAERMFYAFDYGHAILYETLWSRPNAPVSLLEEQIYDRLTRRILVRPPRLPLEEAAIEVEYAKLVPEAKVMFDWAHILHRQTYDVWADERIPLEEKDRHMAEILAYYKSRPDIAFSSHPKSMELMDGQFYSLAFREKYPKFNGLIWAYHWLQIGLYEPLLEGQTPDQRQALVRATVARFWQMLEIAPETMPYLMPMTAAVAPQFAARYPEISIIFDNLHMMHDVVSDILVSDEVPRNRKRAEIMRAIELFRDNTSYITTVDEWRQMSVGMGVHNQGGQAVGYLAALPTPTVPRGMSMAGMDHSDMDHGAHAGHATPGQPGQPGQHEQDAHAGHAPQAQPAAHDMQQMMRLHERLLADPVIHERLARDPELQRLMQEMQARHAMPTMQHDGAMSEMEMDQAMEFIVRLLADPAVEARIHGDPRLHQLWVDPEVQRHLRMLRQMQQQQQ